MSLEALPTIEETRQLLGGVSRRTVLRELDAGELTRVRVRGRVLVDPDSIRAYIQRHRRDGGGRTVGYRLWVNDERTVLVRMWDNGLEVATRDDSSCTWGPPVRLLEEKVEGTARGTSGSAGSPR